MKADVSLLPGPTAGDRGGFGAEAVELSGSGRAGYRGRECHPYRSGAGHSVAVAAVGVGRQIHAVDMEPVHPADAGD